MQERQDHRGQNTSDEAQPNAARGKGYASREEGRDQHFPLKANVENACPFRVEARKACQQQRHAEAHCAVQNRNVEKREKVHQFAPLRPNATKSFSIGMRTILSSAPVNRMTSAWITVTISRGMRSSADSSAPP